MTLEPTEYLLDALWVAVGASILATGIVRHEHGDHRWPEATPFIVGVAICVYTASLVRRTDDTHNGSSNAHTNDVFLRDVGASLALGLSPLLFLLLGLTASGLCIVGAVLLTVGAISAARRISIRLRARGEGARSRT